MKQFCLFILVIVAVVPAIGQTQKGKIFLKNGSIIKGKITDPGTSGNYKVVSAGNIWVFPQDQVEMVQYQFPVKEPIEPDKISKFVNHTQIGVLAGNNENRKPAPFVMHTSLNYKLNDKIIAGLGTGVEFLNETHMPVFANREYRFNSSKFSPYLFMKAGYTFPLENTRMNYYDVIPYYYSYSSSYIWQGSWYTGDEKLKNQGGILLNPGFGVSTMFSQNLGMTFSVGYRYSRLHYKGEQNYAIDVDFNRLSLSVGIFFN
jgi:hypothetical protein